MYLIILLVSELKIVHTYVYIYTCGHNGTIKFVCGHNGTAETTGRTSRSVVFACGHYRTIKIVCGHNGTADTTGRNTLHFCLSRLSQF